MANYNQCIICGKDYRGKKGLACPECHKIVNEHHARLAAGESELAAVRLPCVWVTLGFTDESKVVEKLLISVFNTFTEIHGTSATALPDVRRSIERPNHRADDCPTRYRAVPMSMAQALADLPTAIYNAYLAGEKKGLAQGRNLLTQLAAGELTNSEFEKRAGITGQTGKANV